MKGGATGGGLSTLTPETDINLHFTGDFHAISAANNLLAALLDNHLHQGNTLGIDVGRVLWRRVIDLNDRALRSLVAGLGGKINGVPRETGFDITPASEVMAALCLAEDAEDLRTRLSRLIVALNFAGEPVTAQDLDAVGAMMALLRDALMPNLVQTVEGVPALVHGGPFANIAHGCNSVIATKMALAHADWVVTEAGFGADLGAEKFFDIKCRMAGLSPVAVVLVATVRALKRHGGVGPQDLATPEPDAVQRGMANLEKHIENIQLFGRTPVIAINRFDTDSEEELEVVRRACEARNVPVALSEIFARGGAGGIELARAVVVQAAKAVGGTPPLYDVSASVQEKVQTIATKVYGAVKVNYTRPAERDLAQIESLGYADIPICMAKTPASLSDDPTLAGRPEGFEVTVNNFVLSPGAGFIVAMLGNVLRMPGLPKVPSANRIDLVDGEIVGVS
jgi:formate--tetrahydrofolate ligase